jgi:hypothetical protein
MRVAIAIGSVGMTHVDTDITTLPPGRWRRALVLIGLGVIVAVVAAHYLSYSSFPTNCSAPYGLSLVRRSFEQGPTGHQGYKILAVDDIKEIGRGDHELKCLGNALVNTRLNNTNTVDIHYHYTIHDGQLSVEWSTEPWWE